MAWGVAAPQAKSQFKSRSIANNVEIIIPVPPDVDSPAFKVRADASLVDGGAVAAHRVRIVGHLADRQVSAP